MGTADGNGSKQLGNIPYYLIVFPDGHSVFTASDQFRMIQSLLDQYGLEAVLSAIAFCEHSRIYSANTMKDYLEYQVSINPNTMPLIPAPTVIPVDKAVYHVTTQKRSLEVYAKMGVR